MRREDEEEIDRKVETLCMIISKKQSEFWEERNKAINELTGIVRNSYDYCKEVTHLIIFCT
jgi:hypothetical protein